MFAHDGTLVANAPHMPVHLGSMDRSVETIIRDNVGQIKPGDIYAINAPYNGGTHLPTSLSARRCSTTGRNRSCSGWRRAATTPMLAAFRPGSMSPNATTIEQEGVLFDNFKLVDRGRFRERN